MESVRYSLVLILMIVNGIHSQQDTTTDTMQSVKDKQEHDMNEIKNTIRNISKSILEMKIHSEKQQEDFSKLKDTVKNMSQSIKDMSYLLDRTCAGELCIRPKRYILSTDEATPLQAFRNCQNQNRTLASIDSEEEYNTLNLYLQSFGVVFGYWTSGTRKDASTEFYWKSSGKSLSYAKWYPGEPDSDNCILLRNYNNSAVMSAYPCTSRYRYVCQYRE